MLEIKFQNNIFILQHRANGLCIKQTLSRITGIHCQDIYLLCNGKLVDNNSILDNSSVHAIPKLVGGKGGFGSMLRAIGAQIEKTTNREACRDLSGRRLRDINEEKRLKTWINQQVEREKEAAERKQKKLEKLCEKPRHEFRDATYDKERSELPEKVEDAVLQGLKAADSKQVGEKRKKPELNIVKKKKPKLWVDAEVEDLSTSDSEDSGDETVNVQKSAELGECSRSTSCLLNENDSVKIEES
ncbi:hypothetical protein ILUMI_00842 [Ignelater luminosus]|uniref:SDE2-like domain-containing protein n=1 Tax=Ignelater luminosus TaxID=2038154 RepID=A0A8K0GI10_IGNLU|nr:hypothetical protein ILUMI_00842 [Ignelater luminosus]